MTYQLVECTQAHQVPRCNQCTSFPCEKIREMLMRSAEYQRKCARVCTEKEYRALELAFFRKEQNLLK